MIKAEKFLLYAPAFVLVNRSQVLRTQSAANLMKLDCIIKYRGLEGYQ